jgi:SAM-dependent methyltransferase
MSSANLYSGYDAYADTYDDEKRLERYQGIVEQVEKLILQYLPEGARILDLGCGTGHLVRHLLAKGYRVTGLDSSERMLNYASQNSPLGEFILSDVCSFEFPPTFDAVISTNSPFHHILSFEELKCAFHNVYGSLLENGLFGFDLNVRESLQPGLTFFGEHDDIRDDYCKIQYSICEPEKKLIQAYYTVFQLIESNWQRFDWNLLSKIYSKAEVQSALEEVGFTEIRIYDAKHDLGITDSDEGIACFICRKGVPE